VAKIGGGAKIFRKFLKFSIIGGVTPNFRQFFKNFFKTLQKNRKIFDYRGEGTPDPPLGTLLLEDAVID